MPDPKSHRVLTVVRQAYETARHQRQLWWFGLFATGVGNASYQRPAGDGSMPDWMPYVLVAVGVVSLLAIGMHVVSEGALIHGVAHGRDGGRTSVRVGFDAGLRFAPRVIAVKLLTLLGLLAAAAPVPVPLAVSYLSDGSWVLGGALSAGLLLVMVPVLLTVSLLGTYALRAVVLERLGVLDAFRAARRFLSGRIVTSLWLLLAQAAGGAVVSALGMVVALPVAAIGAALYFGVGLVPAAVTFGALMLPVALALSGALGTFRSSLWTHLYLAERIERA